MFSQVGSVEVHCKNCGQFQVPDPRCYPKKCPKCGAKDAIFLPSRYDQEKRIQDERHPKPLTFEGEPE